MTDSLILQRKIKMTRFSKTYLILDFIFDKSKKFVPCRKRSVCLLKKLVWWNPYSPDQMLPSLFWFCVLCKLVLCPILY